ncbi:MAG TPA: hypothetical protein VNK44_08405 [Candidatus Nitrosotenuis sp.]|nr:hypothetical protein [Candidatus Nitrosotenuis sp.]
MTMDSHLSFLKRAQIGCVAGLVGGFAIFVSIFVIDLGLGAHGAFYKVVGFAAGLDGIHATLFGMVSHMLTASLIGTVFGLGSGLHKSLHISSIKKGAIGGISTGMAVFFVFFMPISTFLVVPLIQEHKQIVEANTLLANMNMIIIGAIEMHIVYGIVMGAFFAIALQVESKKPVQQAKVA